MRLISTPIHGVFINPHVFCVTRDCRLRFLCFKFLFGPHCVGHCSELEVGCIRGNRWKGVYFNGNDRRILPVMESGWNENYSNTKDTILPDTVFVTITGNSKDTGSARTENTAARPPRSCVVAPPICGEV